MSAGHFDMRKTSIQYAVAVPRRNSVHILNELLLIVLMSVSPLSLGIHHALHAVWKSGGYN